MEVEREVEEGNAPAGATSPPPACHSATSVGVAGEGRDGTAVVSGAAVATRVVAATGSGSLSASCVGGAASLSSAGGAGDAATTGTGTSTRASTRAGAGAPYGHAERPQECRICGDGESDGRPLLTPCACAGSLAGIHADCLQTWIERRGETRTDESPADAFTCEVCHAPYAVAVAYRFRCDAPHLCRIAAVRHACEALSLLGSLIVIGIVLTTLPYPAEESTGALVFLAGICIFSVAATASAVLRAASQWRQAASDRTLVSAPRGSPHRPPVLFTPGVAGGDEEGAGGGDEEEGDGGDGDSEHAATPHAAQVRHTTGRRDAAAAAWWV